jgi:hypothetical protein
MASTILGGVVRSLDRKEFGGIRRVCRGGGPRSSDMSSGQEGAKIDE